MSDTSNKLPWRIFTDKQLSIVRIVFLVISVVIVLGAGMFALKLIRVAGARPFAEMALTALTMQKTALLFSNGTLALLASLMVIYGLLSLTMRRWTLHIYDFAVILSLIFIALGDNQIFFFKNLWIWMLVLWVIHRVVLGTLATGRQRS